MPLEIVRPLCAMLKDSVLGLHRGMVCTFITSQAGWGISSVSKVPAVPKT